MTFFALAVCLSLVAYGAAMLIATPLALALRRIALRAQDPDVRCRLLFAARILPAVLGLFAAFGLALPAFVWHEPSQAEERVGPALAILAAVLGAVVLAGLARGVLALLATRRVVREWTRHARPLRLDGISVSAFVVEERFPLVAVVGSLPPRLYVSRTVLERCTSAELAAIVAHESGHLRHGDPWRLLLLRACPDLLALLPLGAAIERQWAESAELAADDHASALSPARSLDLASALIRVARLAGSVTREELPLTALYRGGGIASRVARILDRPLVATPRRGRHDLAVPLAFVAAFATAPIAVFLGALPHVHRLLEAVVHHLG